MILQSQHRRLLTFDRSCRCPRHKRITLRITKRFRRKHSNLENTRTKKKNITPPYFLQNFVIHNYHSDLSDFRKEMGTLTTLYSGPESEDVHTDRNRTTRTCVLGPVPPGPRARGRTVDEREVHALVSGRLGAEEASPVSALPPRAPPPGAVLQVVAGLRDPPSGVL